MEYKLNGENVKKSDDFFRVQIEEAIKQQNIAQSRFHEFSKFKYDEIIKKFYYSFSDYHHFATTKVTLEHKRLHIRERVVSESK